MNEDFVDAIEECAELNSEDYEKEQIHFVKNVYLNHEIKTETPATVLFEKIFCKLFLFIMTRENKFNSKRMTNMTNDDKQDEISWYKI